jgi:vancomycin resistance protein YoaR
MDELTTESSADAAEDATADGTDQPAPADRKRRRWVLPLSLVPAILLVVIVIAWAVDTSSGGVARNVRLAGTNVGRLSETELATQVASLAKDYASVPVEVVASPGKDEPEGSTHTYTTTAGEIGLTIDRDRTVEHALAVGDDSFFLLRPFTWVGSFLSERRAPVSYRVSSDQVATAAVELEGADRTAPTEPTVDLVDGAFVVVPGKPGTGIDPADIAAALPEAAAERGSGDAPVRVRVTRGAIPPVGGEEAAQQAAAGLESLVKDPVEITTSAGSRTIAPDVLRTWVTLATAPDGTVGAGLDPAKVDAGLRTAFKGITGGPVDAHFTVTDGKPTIIPEQAGKICCGAGAAATILSALEAGSRSVALELVDAPPTFTAAEAGKLGIIEEVGHPSEFGPTTEHKCCESRVQNIHHIADIIRGTVILPGQTFSVNAKVGKRTIAGGFTTGGAIIDGRVGTGIGGGISQFATTFFNASLFAGLDFGEYQSHSLYISRYPKGREATLSYPHPDLQIKNTTPYGVLVWPTYTDTSITVHLYSTTYAQVQVGTPTPSPAGNCTKYTTPRTRTYPDGHVVHDTVFARYRPAEGVDC